MTTAAIGYTIQKTVSSPKIPENPLMTQSLFSLVDSRIQQLINQLSTADSTSVFPIFYRLDVVLEDLKSTDQNKFRRWWHLFPKNKLSSNEVLQLFKNAIEASKNLVFTSVSCFAKISYLIDRRKYRIEYHEVFIEGNRLTQDLLTKAFIGSNPIFSCPAQQTPVPPQTTAAATATTSTTAATAVADTAAAPAKK